MHIIKVDLKERAYKIIVGSSIISLLGRYIFKLNIGNDAYIITNVSIKNKYGEKLKNSLKDAGFTVRFKLIPDSERSKSLKVASLIIQDIASYAKKKKIFIIAFGGGVSGDLSGFIASIYKRGVAYIQIPTTLLAQVDSSIGGKTAVDLAQAKNLVGTFYQPRFVFSDVEFLRTLNLEQLQSGLAEIIKYAVIKDPTLFVYLESNYKDVLNLKSSILEFVVRRCSYIKAKIVQKDEREEKGFRTTLNFGHTIGHAIEAASGYKSYSHGKAVALGMLVACDISRRLKFINSEISQRIERLINAVGLPTKIDKLSIADIIKAYYYDKKFTGQKNRFVLIKDIGKAEIVENIPLKIIKEALRNRMVYW